MSQLPFRIRPALSAQTARPALSNRGRRPRLRDAARSRRGTWPRLRSDRWAAGRFREPTGQHQGSRASGLGYVSRGIGAGGQIASTTVPSQDTPEPGPAGIPSARLAPSGLHTAA
jgi:hypothetical protein